VPKIVSERDLPHSAERMLDLVSDVEAYPQFVPLCETVHVRERRVEGDVSTLVSEMTVAYALFRETLTTHVVIDRARRRVEAHYMDGPFEHLRTIWTFQPRDEGRSHVHFDIDYAFRSPAMAALMGPAFARAFEKFADAFASRADLIYGPPALNSG